MTHKEEHKQKQALQPKISPIFFKGVLVYEKSKHSLTHVNGYYICTKKQKKSCDNKNEINLPVKKIDLQMEELLNKWHIPDGLYKEKFLIPYIRATIKINTRSKNESILANEHGMAAVEAMRKDDKLGKKINQRDITFVKEMYLKLLKINYPRFLLTLGMMSVHCLKLENKTGMTMLFKKVYITDNGIINKIEMEGIGEFMLNYIEKIIPGFTNRLGVEIIRPLGLQTSDPQEIVKYFEKNNFSKLLSYSIFRSKHILDDCVESLFKFTKGGNIWEITNLTTAALKMAAENMGVFTNKEIFITKNHFKSIDFEKNKVITKKNTPCS